MLKRYLSVVIVFGSFSLGALAGEFTGGAVDASLDWKPARCPKPAKLFFHITDIDSYNAAVEEYNQYLLDLRTHRSCISEEAQADAKTAAKAISSGVDRAFDEIRTELEGARSELESAKRSLQ